MRHEKESLKPIKRGKLRLILGRAAYTLARYGLWVSGRYHFARHRQSEDLPFVSFSHKTPLLRKLQGVDMQYQYNKIVNLKLAANKLNGLVLRPGETFSYWRSIGNPTTKKGYLEGIVLYCGSFGPGVGGGLCQMSNLIFWMTLHTPLTVTERYRHSFDVFPDAGRTQPFGSGATCVYPYRDLMVTNTTPDTYQLSIEVGSSHLHGCWRCDTEPAWGYEVIEKNHNIKQEYFGGYSRHNELYRRRVYSDGNVSELEFLVENHALMMYAPFLEMGVPSSD